MPNINWIEVKEGKHINPAHVVSVEHGPCAGGQAYYVGLKMIGEEARFNVNTNEELNNVLKKLGINRTKRR